MKHELSHFETKLLTTVKYALCPWRVETVCIPSLQVSSTTMRYVACMMLLICASIGNVCGADIVLNANSITSLKNNDYGDFKDQEADFKVSDSTFVGKDIAYNPNGTPQNYTAQDNKKYNIALQQSIQIKKSTGYIVNKYAANLSSVTIIAYNTNWTVSAGTSKDDLSSVTLPTPTDEMVALYTYANKSKSKSTTNFTLKKYTIDLSKKSFVKIAATNSAAAQIYSITITTAAACQTLGQINGSVK